jgi:hypothetical protein
MTDAQMTFDNFLLPDEDDAGPPIDWSAFIPSDDVPFDEPPPDWDFPPLLLEPPDQDLESMPDWFYTIDPNFAAALDLPHAQGSVGYAWGDENPIERFWEEERRLEADDELEEVEPLTMAELATLELPNEAELMARADARGLYDARFLGRDDLDKAGNVVGHTIQCIEVSLDRNGNFSGQILDIAHYDDLQEAETDYFAIQSTIGDTLPLHRVAAIGELTARQNGIPGAWREATDADLARYGEHLMLEGTSDIPPNDPAMDRALLDSALQIAQMNTDLAEQEVVLNNAQAVEALERAGLEPPADFELERSAYIDNRTGDLLVPGIYQHDLDDPAADCQALFIALQNTDAGMEAEVTPFGKVGNYEEVYPNYVALQDALYEGGPVRALEVIDDIQHDVEYEQRDRDRDDRELSSDHDEWRDKQPESLPGNWMDIN